jgi:hypothetical protein
MLNRIKEWDIKNLKINDRQVISLALILSVMALVMAIPSSTNCASANTCTVASTGTFTGNLGIKSNTAFQLTQQHSLAVDQIANWESVGGNHTGSVIMKDNSGDFNLNGGLRLGTSATSTNGTIRWNGSEVQVYNSGWAGVGGSPTNDIGQVTADSGSFTAATQQDNINIVGGTGITTSVTSDTLTIASSGGGAPMEYFAYANTGGSTSNNDPISYDTEYYDTSNCFTVQGSTTYTFTYTCADTRVFSVLARMVVIDIATTDACGTIYLNVNSTSLGSNNACTSFDATYGMYNDTVCLNQNDTIWFKGYYSNGNTGIIISGIGETNFQLAELVAFGTSQSCTNGRIN